MNADKGKPCPGCGCTCGSCDSSAPHDAGCPGAYAEGFVPGATNPSVAQEATGLQDKIARAYGYLWHVNNSGVGFQFSPEKAAHMARRVLRDTLTHEQRGNAINMAATELFEILRNEGNE